MDYEFFQDARSQHFSGAPDRGHARYLAKDRAGGRRPPADRDGNLTNAVTLIPASEPGVPEFPGIKDRTAVPGPAPDADRTDGDDFELPVKLPADPPDDEPSYRVEESEAGEELEAPGEKAASESGKAGVVLRGAEDDFFRDPARFSGDELEMELQMLTAAKTQKGWLLNLPRIKSGKSADYLYVEDTSILGEKPDLRIGFFYKVRFKCRKGDASSGNTLVGLSPTGGKAVWATGISAIE